jgi:TetR/AcrR family transcriptional regulator, transcriptional repressor for nem operon
MTDLPTSTALKAAEARPGKRERLVAAAGEVVYHQGVEKATLAEIADAADVPLGNVYYYFKTKDEILDALIDSHVRDVEETITTIERRHRTPKGRLKALVTLLADQRETIAQYGCPHGSLCTELEKRTEGADHSVARLMQVPIAWAEMQFQSLGRQDAHDLAVELIVAYQGTAVLTHVLRQPKLMSDEARRLKRWIDAL